MMVRACKLKTLKSDRKGATAVEYGLIMALMTLAVIGAISTTGDATKAKWEGVADEVGAATGQ
ncbi:MAG: Flp family type IVb pilin [Henriciella sp.]|nr:Flp family type IVb pilin [Henriciella sp.]